MIESIQYTNRHVFKIHLNKKGTNYTTRNILYSSKEVWLGENCFYYELYNTNTRNSVTHLSHNNGVKFYTL